MKVVNFGSCNIDYVYSVQSIVRAGETISSQKLEQFPGGKGLNQSIAMARAGLPVCHAGAIGQDGLFLKNLLRESGADVSFLRVLEEKTGHAMIQIDENGENCIVLYGGANQAITTDFIDEVFGTMAQEDVLILQNEISQLPYLVRKAKENGVRLFLNPSPLGDLIHQIDLRDFSCIILNEIEAESLLGSCKADQIIERLNRDAPDLMAVVTLGKKGCFCVDHGKVYSADAFPVKAVDTTGAGDTFTGYFITAYLQTEDIQNALYFASAAAALSITAKGAASSIPKCKTVEDFLEGQNKKE